jgi:hypothetical protein
VSIEAARELITKLSSEIKEEELGDSYFTGSDIDVWHASENETIH